MILNAQVWPLSSASPQTAEAMRHSFVFLHGMGGTGSLWRPIAAMLEDQARILAPDQRGHGKSRPAPDGDFSPLAYGRDTLETIQHFSFSPSILVGHSMGVRSAVAAAHLEPAAVSGLALVDLGLSGAAGGGLGDTLSQFIRILPEQFATRQEARIYMDTHCPDPAIGQYLMAVSTVSASGTVSFPFDHDALIATIDAARDSSIRKWLLPLAESGMPILLLRGANSLVLSAEEFAAEAKAFTHLPNVRAETFENAGHGLPFEQRARFVARLKDFASDLPPRGHYTRGLP